MNQIAEPGASYGGPWTIEKLDILERYLDAYTTALKDQPFKLMYLDAFAGRGRIALPGDEDEDDEAVRAFVTGSTERAVRVNDKSFDRLIFVEKDPNQCAELDKLHAAHPGRDIAVENSEANAFLSGLDENWQQWRGVLFLDPFATEVEWATIEKIAGFNALDTWILFPVSAIARMLPRLRRPGDISAQWVTRLNRVYGDETWQGLYRESRQQNLFGHAEHERDPGVGGFLAIYKNKLDKLFGKRFLEQSRTLKNSRNSPLFEFLFCVGSPRGTPLAKRIAKHIVERL